MTLAAQEAMVKPHFIGIGAQKAGSSWLYKNIREHPGIWLPPVKTIRYFNDPGRTSLCQIAFVGGGDTRRWRRLLLDRLSVLDEVSEQERHWYHRFLCQPRDDQWYLSLFTPPPGRVAGEITPSYCRMTSESVGRLHELLPDVKLIFFVRNPIERTWSHTAMRFRNQGSDIDHLPANEIAAYLDGAEKIHRTSDVLACLETWEQYFPPQQLFIGFFDELHEQPRCLLSRVLEFLDVPASEMLIPDSVGKRRNAGSYGPMPIPFRQQLARRYFDQLKLLHERFANRYTAKWLDGANEDCRRSDSRRP